MGGDKKVLELGSAFLRDAKFLRSLGLNIVCTDIIDQSIEIAKQEGFETERYDFRDSPKAEWLNAFDGVIAKAVLLHASGEQFVNALKNIYTMLKTGGVFELTLKEGEGEEIETEKLDSPRYFKYWKKEEVEKLLTETGFAIVDFRYIDKKWLHFIVKK